MAVPLLWQPMVEQVFVPAVQVNVLPLPATTVMALSRWNVLPVRIDVPVVVVVLWQFWQSLAPTVTCFWWLLARTAPEPALE